MILAFSVGKLAAGDEEDKGPMHEDEFGTSSSQRSNCSESVSSSLEYQLPACDAGRVPDIFERDLVGRWSMPMG